MDILKNIRQLPVTLKLALFSSPLFTTLSCETGPGFVEKREVVVNMNIDQQGCDGENYTLDAVFEVEDTNGDDGNIQYLIEALDQDENLLGSEFKVVSNVSNDQSDIIHIATPVEPYSYRASVSNDNSAFGNGGYNEINDVFRLRTGPDCNPNIEPNCDLDDINCSVVSDQSSLTEGANDFQVTYDFTPCENGASLPSTIYISFIKNFGCDDENVTITFDTSNGPVIQSFYTNQTVSVPVSATGRAVIKGENTATIPGNAYFQAEFNNHSECTYD